ncbi:MAG: putative sulfate exporter family transporter, partial [Chloroflexi bacterium]|nr:putative sulfate exporter family transporter [Chloroflexota bacterium]
TAVPAFVIGFLALATLRSLGVIGAQAGDVLASIGGFAILVGLAGIGHGLRTTRPRRSDLRALALGGAIMVAMSAAVLAFVTLT